ncbi:MAG: hypothetical protein IAE99_09195 [Rhodothermales bacterium]|nr:hypothetical protein [Rhodothermales bacterium]
MLPILLAALAVTFAVSTPRTSAQHRHRHGHTVYDEARTHEPHQGRRARSTPTHRSRQHPPSSRPGGSHRP